MRILFIILTVVCVRLSGQTNLVPNPSFELYDTCPNSTNDLENARPWFQPNNPSVSWYGSSDFMHSCNSGNVGAPSNVFGYQSPRTGQGYAGFSPYADPSDLDWHEFIEVCLDSTLRTDRRYCFSFYLCLANTSGVCSATSAIGVYLSNDTCQYVSPNYTALSVQPQLINSPQNVISDSVNWTLVELIYEAQGGERYITIGNFWGAAYNVPNSVNLCTNNGGAAYYYIDDVSVVMLPEINSGADSTIIRGDTITLSGFTSEYWPGMQYEWVPHTGLDDPYALNTGAHPDTTTTYVLSVSCPTCDVPCLGGVQDSVTIIVQEDPISPEYPLRVPTLLTNDQSFYIEGLEPYTRLNIYDSRGRLLFASENYRNDLSLANYSSGIYNYRLELSSGQVLTGVFSVFQR